MSDVPKDANEVSDASEEGLQMSFLDHLDELRIRLIRSVTGVAICFALCFIFAKPIFHFLEKPVKQQLRKAGTCWPKRSLVQRQGCPRRPNFDHRRRLNIDQ